MCASARAGTSTATSAIAIATTTVPRRCLALLALIFRPRIPARRRASKQTTQPSRLLLRPPDVRELGDLVRRAGAERDPELRDRGRRGGAGRAGIDALQLADG